jgi:hypothetical protein
MSQEQEKKWRLKDWPYAAAQEASRKQRRWVHMNGAVNYQYS